MAKKKPLRATRQSFMERFMSSRRTAALAAASFVAIIGVLAFASTLSAPAADRSSADAPRAARTAVPTDEALPAVDRVAADTTPERAEFVGPQPEIVTLTGCLERTDDELRLSETSGAHAPKARSWKSGFLRRRPATITVLPVSKQLDLSKHVGQRVTVTGSLVDREMRVRTLRRVAPCGDGSRV